MTPAVVDDGGGPPAFVLIPGAGGSAWYWHLLVAELAARGFDAVAVDLPAGDESAGLEEYADAVVHALGSPSRPGHRRAVPGWVYCTACLPSGTGEDARVPERDDSPSR